MVIDLNILKARFASGDLPTASDFADLIDSLAANSTGGVTTAALADGSVTTAKIQDLAVTLAKLAAGTDGQFLQTSGSSAVWGAAGGLAASASGSDLTGTYPTLTLKNGVVTLARLNLTGAVENSTVRIISGVPVWSIDTPPSDLVVRQPVSGAVKLFTSALQALATSDTALTVAHGLSQIPTNLRWVAVCIASAGFANYIQNEEVPIEYFVDPTLPGNQVLFPSADPTNVYLRIETTNGIAVRDKTSTANGLVTLSNPADYAKWSLKAYATVLVNGDGFGSLTEFAPAPQNIPAVNTAVTFTHSFAKIPSMVRVTLLCNTADNGFVSGDEIPIDSAFVGSTNTNPAFTVKLSTTTIVVTNNVATTAIEVIKPSDGSINAITAADWQIKVLAHSAVSVPTRIFPHLTFDIANPGGCISYLDKFYVLQFDRHNSTSNVWEISLTNGNVTRRIVYSPYRWAANMAMFKTASGRKLLTFTTMSGISYLDLLSPNTNGDWYLASGLYPWKVAYIYEGGVGTTTHPDIYLILSNVGYSRTASHLDMQKQIWNGSAYVGTSMAAVDFSNSAIVNSSNNLITPSSDIILCQYNHVSHRIYIVENSTGMLSIFRITSGTIKDFWPEIGDTPVYTNLTFEKCIAIPGSGAYWSDSQSENYAVEYDLDNGTEYAISMSRRGVNTFTGTVSRIPWIE